MSGSPIVSVEQVDKTFYTHHFFERNEETGRRRFHTRRRVSAAKGISFDIQRGEIFGLLGPNGAGKTTTVKMMCGLVCPDAGQVVIDGHMVERDRLKVLEKIGVVLEGTRTCIWQLTPLENLAYYGNLKNVRGRVLKERARELIDFIGLHDERNVQVRRLSRGQKQKLALCIALIADPDIVLLDEPTTGLDVQSNRNMRERITAMARERGVCALVTTHDMHVAQSLCDRIGIIQHGKLIACKPTAELMTIFAEQTYTFRVDAAPDTQAIATLAGVQMCEVAQTDGAHVLQTRLTPDEALRSAALYDIIEELRRQELRLLDVHQDRPNLESVFMRITRDGGA